MKLIKKFDDVISVYFLCRAEEYERKLLRDVSQDIEALLKIKIGGLK